MDFQIRRPFSARSRLESVQPLTSTSPTNRAPARSNSQSAAGSIATYNAERARILGDSARAHGSPSKTRSVSRSQNEPRTDLAVPAPPNRGCSSCFTLLLVVLLFFWQGLVFLVLLLTLRAARDINQQISITGGYGAALNVDEGWAYNLQDRRLARNVTTNAVSRSDVVALHSANSTFTRRTMLWAEGSTHSVTSLALGDWAVLSNDMLALNVTSCAGDTLFTCLDSAQNALYKLSSKGNSLVLLGSSDGTSNVAYAYQPGT